MIDRRIDKCVYRSLHSVYLRFPHQVKRTSLEEGFELADK